MYKIKDAESVEANKSCFCCGHLLSFQILRIYQRQVQVSFSLKLEECFLIKGQSIITFHKMSNSLDPPFFFVHTCSILVAPSPLSNVQNLTSTPLTFTTTPHKSSKFCKFIVLLPVVISPCKYHKKCNLSVRQIHSNTIDLTPS